MPKKAEKKESTEKKLEESVDVVIKKSSKKATKTKKETKEIETSVNNLSDFDWHNYEEGIDQVDEKQIKEFEKLVEENFVETLTNNVVEGTVIHMTDREAIIDINAKSEGVISLNEFRYNPALKVGDKVEVLIDIREDATGQLILSHRKARVIKAWERVNDAHDSGEIVNGFVK